MKWKFWEKEKQKRIRYKSEYSSNKIGFKLN